MEAEEERSPGCCRNVRGPPCLIYTAHFLSAWGDRMWHFAVGLYLVYLDNKSLRLAAIYGFSSGGAVLLFGGLIGDWVDRNRRLKVVRTFLFIQNSAVIASAVSILLRLHYEREILELLDGHLSRITEAVVIILAIVAMLASVGSKIAIEKDWIVVVAGTNRDKLANLNASTRAIDQLCKIVSPLAVGQVMTFASLKVGAATIAGWNLVSMFVEYYILYRVYKAVPELAERKKKHESSDQEKSVEMENMKERENLKLPDQDENENTEIENVSPDKSLTTKTKEDEDVEIVTKEKKKKGTLEMMFERLTMIFKGWPIYMKQKVVYAGMALSGLYMTVLGFDSVTVGYAYALNMKEWVLGLCMGLGGLTGIIATFIYPRSRKAIGLERTGLFAFAAEIACLTLCVVSIWTPGSPSNMYKDAAPVFEPGENCTTNEIIINSNASMGVNNIYTTNNVTLNVTLNGTVLNNVNTCTINNRSIVSVVLFLVGIITSRIGLWMADLTITQIIQENVSEHQRGVVGGVQSSLNMLLDMLKFVMVIVAPRIETFGILILISYLFIVLSGCLFSYHSWRVRGHLFHFDKIRKCVNGDSSGRPVPVET